MAEKGHLPGWLRENRVSIQALCEPNPLRRRRAKALLPRARIYPTQERMLREEELDFVDVCTPPPFHAENTLAALRAGVHVLCEKPFVGSRAEFRSITRLCGRMRRIAFPVHNWKHAPILAGARNWIAQGLLGEVLHSEFHTLRTQPAVGLTPWRADRQNAGGGGILLDHGWHGIYLLLNFHRERPAGVSAWMDPSPSRSGQAENTLFLRLEFPSSTGSLFLTWKASHRYNAGRIYGTRGTLVIEDDRLRLCAPGTRDRSLNFPAPLSQGSHHPDWFGPIISRFLSAMEHPEEAARELEEARMCLEIIRLGYLSALRQGNRLEIP